jgi:hypothetical protein
MTVRPERAKRVEGRLALLAAVTCSLAAGHVACKNGRAEDRRRPTPLVRHDAGPAGELQLAAPGAMCITRGTRAFDGSRMTINEPTVRVVAPSSHGDAVALRFTFNGDSDEKAALASGQVRRQLGLKLRAGNGCNLVYVMWRLDPTPFVEVSTKINPGAKDHDDCGAGGYTKVKAVRSEPPPPLRIGASHTLAAEIIGDELTARIDEKVVWRGRLADDVRALDGPTGFRTDNVAIDAELLVAPIPTRHAVPGCD